MAYTNGAVEDTYLLTRDAPETARLDGQHLVWKTKIGFLLHLRIAETSLDNAAIGEVGTGTGVWLLDLAREQEGKERGWSYYGLDMSAAQFPSITPPGVHFSTLNILDPVPAELENTFDVLHLRFLVLGLPAGTWGTASENIFKLLKPGGWVQWEETNLTEMRTLQNVPRASILACTQIRLDLVSALGKTGSGFADSDRLAEIVAVVGFDGVNEDIFASDHVAATRAGFSKTIIGAMTGMMKMLAARQADGEWESQDKKGLYAAMLRELEGGDVYFRADLRVVTGRKGG